MVNNETGIELGGFSNQVDATIPNLNGHQIYQLQTKMRKLFRQYALTNPAAKIKRARIMKTALATDRQINALLGK